MAAFAMLRRRASCQDLPKYCDDTPPQKCPPSERQVARACASRRVGTHSATSLHPRPVVQRRYAGGWCRAVGAGVADLEQPRSFLFPALQMLRYSSTNVFDVLTEIDGFLMAHRPGQDLSTFVLLHTIGWSAGEPGGQAICWQRPRWTQQREGEQLQVSGSIP